MSVRRAITLLAGAVLGLSGCQAGGGRIERGPAPPFAESAEKFNAGLSGLGRLWARATVRAKYTDPEGERRTEQGEGHLQCILPDRLALNVGKVGETLAYLGCNAERYWWFELHERKEAWVGEAGAPLDDGTPVPIRPEDAALLLGLSRVDPAQGEARWSEDGRWLILDSATERGARSLWVDPSSFRPGRVELRDADGRLQAWSVMKGDQEVFAPGTPGSPRIYKEITLSVPESETEIRLSLGDPQSTKSKPVESAFDLELLLDAYGIEVVHALSSEPDAP